LKLRWSALALRDFIDATDHIAQDNPDAARQVAERILEATQRLRDYPFIGRLGEDEETREWLVQRTPYLLVYEIHDDTIFISRVWHTSRERDPGEASVT
jgi:addiction module RelE/StbE family toxin